MAQWSKTDLKYLGEHIDDAPRELWRHFGGLHGTVHAYRAKRNRTKMQLAAGIVPVSVDVCDADERVARIGRLADLLERNGIDPADVGNVERIRLNDYEGFIKNADSEVEKVHLQAATILIKPSWDEGPAWPVVQPAPAIHIRPSTIWRAKQDMETAVVLPDPQIGFYRDANGELHPTHDEQALSVALQITREVHPSRVILAGDTMDFPEFGRYRQQPAFARTSQATIDRTTQYVAEIRAGGTKDMEIDWIEGNHEIRVQNYLKDNAAAAFGLKPGNVPDAWPVLSVPVLCRLDELGVKYHSGYPAVVLWLSDRLRVVHGDRASKRSNAYPYLDEFRTSTIYAHTHRREWAERTRQGRNGPRTILAASPGCLCRIDGKVPSANSGTDLDGVPIENWQDWQQGFAIVHYTPDDGPFAYEPVAIHHGNAWWRGHRYTAPCDVEGNELSAGRAA